MRALLKQRWVEPHAALIQFADGTFGRCMGIYKALETEAEWHLVIVKSEAKRAVTRVAVCSVERDATLVRRVVLGFFGGSATDDGVEVKVVAGDDGRSGMLIGAQYKMIVDGATLGSRVTKPLTECLAAYDLRPACAWPRGALGEASAEDSAEDAGEVRREPTAPVSGEPTAEAPSAAESCICLSAFPRMQAALRAAGIVDMHADEASVDALAEVVSVLEGVAIAGAVAVAPALSLQEALVR